LYLCIEGLRRHVALLKLEHPGIMNWHEWIAQLQSEELISYTLIPGELREFPRMQMVSYRSRVRCGSFRLTLMEPRTPENFPVQGFRPFTSPAYHL
jgi:hypothetical protein